MDLFTAFLLGALQGITEFLPISSSGHLVVFESFFKLDVANLTGFDIAVHFGTLLAIFVYFWSDFVALFKSFLGFFPSFSKFKNKDGEKLIFYLILGTLPAVVVGLLFGDWLEDVFRNPKYVAGMFILVGLYFVIAEFVAKKLYTSGKKIGLLQAIIVGLVQSVALIPGISRSGSTISTGLMTGLSRTKSARFSFLLGAVAISAATLWSLIKVFKGTLVLPGLDVLIVGVLSAMVFGYLSVSILMKFLKSHSLVWFSVYLFFVGGVLVFIG